MSNAFRLASLFTFVSVKVSIRNFYPGPLVQIAKVKDSLRNAWTVSLRWFVSCIVIQALAIYCSPTIVGVNCFVQCRIDLNVRILWRSLFSFRPYWPTAQPRLTGDIHHDKLVIWLHTTRPFSGLTIRYRGTLTFPYYRHFSSAYFLFGIRDNCFCLAE